MLNYIDLKKILRDVQEKGEEGGRGGGGVNAGITAGGKCDNGSKFSN